MRPSLDYIGNQPLLTAEDVDLSGDDITVSSLTSTGTVKSSGFKDSSDRTLVVKNAAGTVVWGN